LSKVLFEEYSKTFYYMDKINLLDPNDESLEGFYPTDKPSEVYIANSFDEEVAHFGMRELTDIKKLYVELHSLLVKVPFLKPQSDLQKFFDLTDDKKISIDGYLFPYLAKSQKYQKHQSCLITTSIDPELLR